MTTSGNAAHPRRIEYLPLDQVYGAARNPKEHALPDLKRSVSHFGYVEPMVLDERTGHLVAGHGRVTTLRAQQDAGESVPDGITVDDDGTWLAPVMRGWASRSDDDAEAYLLMSNQSSTKGGWDERALVEVLEDLSEAQMLELSGFSPDDMSSLLERVEQPDLPDDDGTATDDADKGEALQLAGITVGEPDMLPTSGEVWHLGGHHLVVADVHTGWDQWVPYLTGEDDLFWPYPTPLAPFAKEAHTRHVVMVQPNTYLAGWLLTKYRDITGSTPTTEPPE